jgi:hypothetical protein
MHQDALHQLARERGEERRREASAEALALEARGTRPWRRRRLGAALGLAAALRASVRPAYRPAP